jgi:transposase-like protein
MPERIPMTARKKCPRPECGSEDVREATVDERGDWRVEGVWLCNKCEKPFQLRDGYA